ncbi:MULTISPECIES: hypothetical protein [Pseudomonas]|nr:MULTISPECIES: hypothetical protein [Pseudomonas]
MDKMLVVVLVFTLGLGPYARGAEVTGWVTVYPSYKSLKPPERASENSAVIILSENTPSGGLGMSEVTTKKNGEFSWEAPNTLSTELSLMARHREKPNSYEMRSSYKFELVDKGVSLNEIALVETNRLASDQYSIANKKLSDLAAQYPCLTHGKSHAAIETCWRRDPAAFEGAYPQARKILAELEKIKIKDNYRYVFSEKIHLMTLLTMYCAQSKFSEFDQGWIDQEDHARELREQVFSLYECAKGKGVEVESLSYREVRNYIASRTGERSSDAVRGLLRVWLDTYYSEANTTEAAKVADFIRLNQYVTEWEGFVTLLHGVARGPFLHSATTLTPQSVDDAKRELMSL